MVTICLILAKKSRETSQEHGVRHHRDQGHRLLASAAARQTDRGTVARISLESARHRQDECRRHPQRAPRAHGRCRCLVIRRTPVPRGWITYRGGLGNVDIRLSVRNPHGCTRIPNVPLRNGESGIMCGAAQVLEKTPDTPSPRGCDSRGLALNNKPPKLAAGYFW